MSFQPLIHMFSITVESNTPLTPLDNVNDIAIEFLTHIGYLSKGYTPRSDAEDTSNSIPYVLFMDCFMKHPHKAWTADELAYELKTTKATVYRHINKLKSLDLLEEASAEQSYGKIKKGYKIRFGDLRKAWSFVEANVQMAMQNYRKTVEHFCDLMANDNTD